MIPLSHARIETLDQITSASPSTLFHDCLDKHLSDVILSVLQSRDTTAEVSRWGGFTMSLSLPSNPQI